MDDLDLDASKSIWAYLIGIVIALIIGWICARIAGRKGYPPLLFGVLGFFFSCVTLIVVLVIPRRNPT